MEWFRLIGLCLLAAALIMLLRQMQPPFAGLVCAAFGAIVFGLLLPEIREYLDTLHSFFATLSLDAAYYSVLLRAMGIVLVTQFAGQICREMGAPSVATNAELCGRVALLGVALPVFMNLTQTAVGALR